jgi:hypothetical protein
MRAEMLIDLMHDGLLTIQRDVARLAEAMQERESGYYAFFTRGAQLTDHAIEVQSKIERIVAALEPLVLEHIEASAKADREHGKAAH